MMKNNIEGRNYRPLLRFRLPLVLMLIFVLISPGQPDAAWANVLRAFKPGDKLPVIELPELASGRKIAITPGQDKPSALFFFSINPDFRKKRALALLSELASLAGHYRNRVNIVGIYVEDSGKEVVEEYMKTITVPVTVLYDVNRDVYNRYGIFMMPLIVLADKSGALHEVVPYTYDIKKIVDSNLKFLLGDISEVQLREELKPKINIELSKEEKEYIRRVNYGKVMASRKMYGQAIREFNTAATLMPKQTAAYVELGFVHIVKQDWAEAEKAFKKVLAAEPESDDGVAGLGLALYGKGDVEGAFPKLEMAFIAPKPRLEVILALAEIHEQKKNYEKALRLNKLAISRLMVKISQRWN
ncbi:MAG: redoxin domain-containing protein [Proteobacteria bacterium]|nr:redoxin domain-containing protein [Pseudomonadota bacterium]MBU1738833.1 redoxin domain-containing protein [Pseudomonadota bacterium]